MAGQVAIEAITTSAPRLTMVVGDQFRLAASATYTRGKDHFSRAVTGQAAWSSADPNLATVEGGVVRAIRAGGPVAITASLNGKDAITQLTVVEAPQIRRIRFQVSDVPPRAGWDVDNGMAYTDTRTFGWLDTHDLDRRNDRNSAHGLMLKAFVLSKGKQFKVKLPAGQYTVRVAMGDSDYGAPPFEDWIDLGSEKILYYEGHDNSVATRIVSATNDGLVFTVMGPINYLVIVPIGTDIDKYADDGLQEETKQDQNSKSTRPG